MITRALGYLNPLEEPTRFTSYASFEKISPADIKNVLVYVVIAAGATIMHLHVFWCYTAALLFSFLFHFV
jgi:hypothetical protein